MVEGGVLRAGVSEWAAAAQGGSCIRDCTRLPTPPPPRPTPYMQAHRSHAAALPTLSPSHRRSIASLELRYGLGLPYTVHPTPPLPHPTSGPSNSRRTSLELHCGLGSPGRLPARTTGEPSGGKTGTTLRIMSAAVMENTLPSRMLAKYSNTCAAEMLGGVLSTSCNRQPAAPPPPAGHVARPFPPAPSRVATARGYASHT